VAILLSRLTGKSFRYHLKSNNRRVNSPIRSLVCDSDQIVVRSIEEFDDYRRECLHQNKSPDCNRGCRYDGIRSVSLTGVSTWPKVKPNNGLRGHIDGHNRHDNHGLNAVDNPHGPTAKSPPNEISLVFKSP
jgi:hypothetical protein